MKARRRRGGERGGEQKEKEKASKLTGEQRLKVTEIAQSAQLPEELSVAARGGHLPSAREGRGYKRWLQASLAGVAGYEFGLHALGTRGQMRQPAQSKLGT